MEESQGLELNAANIETVSNAAAPAYDDGDCELPALFTSEHKNAVPDMN